jgi:outer membrane receptor protein involved in Fe transport
LNRIAVSVLAALTGIATAARAETSSDPTFVVSSLEPVVISTTPIPGADEDLDRVPRGTNVLGTGDINRTGVPSLTGAILSSVPSATINDTEGNDFQPDILFRGFTASPVAGTPEGLAVYVNGARFNDAFGDTVNWDLIPPTAIESATLEASNPLFGLNALGGSINIRLKNGFTSQDKDVTAYGGSYGRGAGIVQFGRQSGDFAIYVAADGVHDDGFRQTSASNLYRLYTDLGWRARATELHVEILAAHNTLGNPGATPVQALDANISNIFTAPNSVDNKYLSLNVNGTYRASEAISLQGLAYSQTFSQDIPNGTTVEVDTCTNNAALLCNDDGTVVTGPNGQPVPDFLHGGPYSGLSTQLLTTHAYGLSGQFSDDAPLADHRDHLVAGLSFSGSNGVFNGDSEIGGFDPYTREFLAPGVVQDQPSEGINPVRVHSATDFYGVFVSDTWSVTSDLDLNVAGRYNDAQIHLRDELGGPVSGDHTFTRFNPSAGLVYRASDSFQVYGSYSETNRAPTPQELSCASAAAPCSLLNFFVGDPDLRQVVAHTEEGGLRGNSKWGTDQALRWNVDVYHIANTNDIIYESTVYNPNLAFYTNAGHTRRQGIEANARYDGGPVHVSLGYALTDATFQSALLLNSGSNPAADANGQELIQPGDRIPGIPRQRVEVVLDYSFSKSWSLGGTLTTQSSAYRFGDEANLTEPVGGYTIVDLNGAYHAENNLTVFAIVRNVFDRHYYTYGSFGPVSDVPWPNVPGGVTDTRTASPGIPIAAYAGIRYSF